MDKGYGFIIKKYNEGQKVTFDVTMTARGRYASNIHKV